MVTAPRLGCARRGCCERRPSCDEDALEAVGERVAKEVVEAYAESLMVVGTAGLPERADAVAAAITGELAAAAPGVGFRLAVHGGLGGSRITATQRVGECEPTDESDTLNLAVSVGLCVLAGPRRTWFVHSPAVWSTARL